MNFDKKGRKEVSLLPLGLLKVKGIEDLYYLILDFELVPIICGEQRYMLESVYTDVNEILMSGVAKKVVM